MKISEQQLSLVPTPIKLLKDLPHGEVFVFNGSYRMKLKPTQFLLNSSLVSDVLNRADCFVCDIEKGTLYIMQGTSVLDGLPDATLLIRKD